MKQLLLNLDSSYDRANRSLGNCLEPAELPSYLFYNLPRVKTPRKKRASPNTARSLSFPLETWLPPLY